MVGFSSLLCSERECLGYRGVTDIIDRDHFRISKRCHRHPDAGPAVHPDGFRNRTEPDGYSDSRGYWLPISVVRLL